MKKIFLFSAVLCISLLTGAVSYAADLNDHVLYRIVTYTFNDGTMPNAATATGTPHHYNPLMIAGTKTDMTPSEPSNQDQFAYSSAKPFAQGFALSANIDATPKLSFQGVIGVVKNGPNTLVNSNFDSSWEANLGVIYKLFNHLSYEVHFGFMDTGNLFKNNNAYSDVESVVMISNQLTMSF